MDFAAELVTELVHEKAPFPILVAVLTFLVLAQLAALLRILIPVWLRKKDSVETDDKRHTHKTLGELLTSIKNLLHTDTQERVKRQVEVDGRFGKIESHIEKTGKHVEHLNHAVTDLEDTVLEISQNTLENRLFEESLPVFRRLKAFRRLMALNVNGAVRIEGIELACANPAVWFHVLSVPLGIKITDQRYFDGVIEEISKRMHNGNLA